MSRSPTPSDFDYIASEDDFDTQVGSKSTETPIMKAEPITIDYHVKEAESRSDEISHSGVIDPSAEHVVLSKDQYEALLRKISELEVTVLNVNENLRELRKELPPRSSSSDMRASNVEYNRTTNQKNYRDPIPDRGRSSHRYEPERFSRREYSRHSEDRSFDQRRRSYDRHCNERKVYAPDFPTHTLSKNQSIPYRRIPFNLRYEDPKCSSACHFCSLKHFINQCPHVSDPKQRRKILRLSGLCTRCVGKHRESECRRAQPCYYCGSDMHHQALCVVPNTQRF